MLASEHILIDISLFSFSLPAGRQVYHQLYIFDQRQYRAEARLNVPKSNDKIKHCRRSVRAGNTAPIAIGDQHNLSRQGREQKALDVVRNFTSSLIST